MAVVFDWFCILVRSLLQFSVCRPGPMLPKFFDGGMYDALVLAFSIGEARRLGGHEGGLATMLSCIAEDYLKISLA